MSERQDLEASLTEMHRKLHELQYELALLTQAPQQAPEPPPPPAPTPEAEELEYATTRVAELRKRVDELVDLRNKLDLATKTLQEEHARAAGGGPSR